MNFIKYLNFKKTIENNKNIYFPENFDWTIDFKLPDIGLDLPEIEKSSIIQMIMDKINPIYIGLSDGSKLFFTVDEFKKIIGTPAVGKTLMWKLQRLPNDVSNNPSKITMCKVM
jgi:hypothetical protein